MATTNYATALIKYVLTVTVLFQASISATEPKECTAGDFGNLLLQCNENKTRSIVPYMRRQWWVLIPVLLLISKPSLCVLVALLLSGVGG